VAAHLESEPYPDFDISELIGLPLSDALALAKANGVVRTRVIEYVNGTMVGAIDLVLARNRLDLSVSDGRVVYAHFPTFRHAGRSPLPIQRP